MFNGQNCDPTKLFQKANQFNNFFCSVGKDLAKKVSLFQTVDYSLYLGHCIPNSFFLNLQHLMKLLPILVLSTRTKL